MLKTLFKFVLEVTYAAVVLSLVGIIIITSVDRMPQDVTLEPEYLTEDIQLMYTKVKAESGLNVNKYPLIIIVSPALNAYTDYKAVYITTSLLSYVTSNGELAFMMGHELGHIVDSKLHGLVWKPIISEQRADLIGQVIANKAGYRACKGAEFFFRLFNDYGDVYPTSHPLRSLRAVDNSCKGRLEP